MSSVRERQPGRGPLYLAAALALALAGCAPPGSGAASQLAPSATHTPAPRTSTISAPPATADLLALEARGAVGSAAKSVTVAYAAAARKATVTITITGIVPDTGVRMNAAWERTKTLCFQEQHALWASGLPLEQVMVVVLGPTQDEYDDTVNQWYGIAVVSAATARRIPWANATPDSVWGAYDQGWLREQFTLFDDIPPAPPLPTATAP